MGRAPPLKEGNNNSRPDPRERRKSSRKGPSNNYPLDSRPAPQSSFTIFDKFFFEFIFRQLGQWTRTALANWSIYVQRWRTNLDKGNKALHYDDCVVGKTNSIVRARQVGNHFVSNTSSCLFCWRCFVSFYSFRSSVVFTIMWSETMVVLLQLLVCGVINRKFGKPFNPFTPKTGQKVDLT